MKMPASLPHQHGVLRRSESGQVLVLYVFFFMLLMGVFLVTININRMAEAQIQNQVAADTGAMAGGRVQALALGHMALTNDVVGVCIVGQIASFFTLQFSAFNTFGKVKQKAWDSQKWINEKKKKFKVPGAGGNEMELSILHASIQSATFAVGRANGATVCINYPLTIEGINHPQLDYSYQWLYMKQFYVRDDDNNKIKEKTTAIAVKMAPAKGDKLAEKGLWQQVLDKEDAKADRDYIPVGKAWLGDDTINFPALITFGSSKPYFIIDTKSPRSGEMGLFMPTLAAFLPGPWFGTRLVESGPVYQTRKDAAVWGLINMLASARNPELFMDVLGKMIKDLIFKPEDNEVEDK